MDLTTWRPLGWKVAGRGRSEPLCTSPMVSQLLCHRMLATSSPGKTPYNNVDDILITGSDPALISRVMADLHKKFALKTLGSISYFLGFEASRDANGIFLSQQKYVNDLLKKDNMFTAKPCLTSVCTG